jgi:multidrug efflux system membrane fusion protein
MMTAQVAGDQTNQARTAVPQYEHRHPSAPTEHRRSVWGTIIGILVLMAVVGGGAYWLVNRSSQSAAASANAKSAAGRPIPVNVGQATRGDMKIYLTGLGNVTAYNTVTLRTRVDGQIMKINFVEGQMVKEGDVLVEIDPRPYQTQLMQAQGQLLKDQAQMKDAQLTLDRYMAIPNSVTVAQIDTQKATVSQWQGAVESDQSQVNNANLNLTYCEVTSPISGRIGLRLVDVGNIVHASDTGGLAVITQLQPIAVIFTVPEDQITDVFRRPGEGQGLPVIAYNRDLSKKITTGKVLAIDNQVDPTTGTVKIKAEFANLDNALFPNQFVNARLLIDTLKDVVLIPTAAIQLGPQNQFVYVAKPDNTVSLRTVKVGAKEGGETVVEEGVAPGELVVTDGVDKLVEGAKVTTHLADDTGATTRPAHGGKKSSATQSASGPAEMSHQGSGKGKPVSEGSAGQ